MTIKQIFKIVNGANAFNELMGENKKNFISLTDNRFFILKDKKDNFKFYTLSEMKKALNYTYTKEAIEKIINADFKQDEEYKNYFEFEQYDLGIFEEQQ